MVTLTSVYSAGWERTLHLSLLYSDNVFESIDQTQDDGAARLRLCLCSPAYRIHPNLICKMDLQGGYEGYHQHPVENRWVHQITGLTGWQPVKNISIHLQIREKTRYFFDTAQGYNETTITPAIRFLPGAGISLEWEYAWSDRNFRNGSLFDSYSSGNKFNAKWRISRAFAVTAFYHEATQQFVRKALVFVDTLSFTESEADQRDQFEQIGFQIELYFNALIRAGFIQERNQSNSHGFNYTKPQIHFLCAKTFPGRWTASFFMRLAWKNYKDSFAPFWPVSTDTEIEENNSIWMMVSKDIHPALTAKAQVGWHRNESPFRNRYYSKHYFILGISYTF